MEASLSSKEQVSTRAWIRSRAAMGKCNWHLGQTFRLSSNSLSYILTPHFLHLVQRPSGMSRLREGAPASLGFLTKFAWASDGGGVTAGSTFSKPRVFLVNEVVAILESCCFLSFANCDSIYDSSKPQSSPARDRPHTHVASPGLPQGVRARAGRGARRHDI